MDHYCVVMCGLQAGAPDEASAWLPVAATLKLDQAEFERRVLAALPRIVRRGVDHATAERIAHGLQAMHVDARVLPDDPNLAYLDRGGATRGPLPQSSLGDFIRPGESFRLRGEQAWQPWTSPVDAAAATPATPIVGPDPVAASLPLVAPGEAPGEILSMADITGDVGEARPDELSSGADDVAPFAASTVAASDSWNEGADATADHAPADETADATVATPPPQSPPEATPSYALPDEQAGLEPATDTPDAAHHVPPVPADATAPVAPDARMARAPAAIDTGTPARSVVPRLIMLLVLIALAVWAYRHWMTDTRTDGSPATSSVGRSATVAAPPAAAPGATTAQPASATSTTDAGG